MNYQQTTMESFSMKPFEIKPFFPAAKKGGKREKTVAFPPELCYYNCCVIKKTGGELIAEYQVRKKACQGDREKDREK